MQHFEAPMVSVIVPVYNVEKYLSRCLDSILAQSLQSIEVICIDDGSIDRSPEILNEYAGKDARIKVITQEALRGPQKRNIYLQRKISRLCRLRRLGGA